MSGTAQLYYKDVSNPNADGTYNFAPVEGESGTIKVGEVGLPSEVHNRLIGPVAETQVTMGHMTFTAAENVSKVRFKLVANQGTPAAGAIVRVVFDAMPIADTTDDTQAWNWLQPATVDEDTDVQYDELVYIPATTSTSQEGVWSRWFLFDTTLSPLRRCDFTYPAGGAGVTSLNVIAEAE